MAQVVNHAQVNGEIAPSYRGSRVSPSSSGGFAPLRYVSTREVEARAYVAYLAAYSPSSPPFSLRGGGYGRMPRRTYTARARVSLFSLHDIFSASRTRMHTYAPSHNPYPSRWCTSLAGWSIEYLLSPHIPPVSSLNAMKLEKKDNRRSTREEPQENENNNPQENNNKSEDEDERCLDVDLGLGDEVEGHGQRGSRRDSEETDQVQAADRNGIERN
ncbi:hypothetical protein B0H13DRAFT_1917488 [Mycena leptocephala]|nr:hypothetical protein B0H13DRAFT_1917488 [Mycena leptocephala]